VKVEPADDLAEGLAGGYPSRVAVELADGTRHEALGRRVPGHIDNPLTREHLEQKLRPGAVAVLGADAVGPLAAAVWDLDQLDDIRTFTDRLAGPVPIRGGPR